MTATSLCPAGAQGPPRKLVSAEEGAQAKVFHSFPGFHSGETFGRAESEPDFLGVAAGRSLFFA